MSALTSEFTRSFFPAVLVPPAWFIPSNRRRITLGDCLLRHMIFQTSDSPKLWLGTEAASASFTFRTSYVDHRAYKADGDSRRAVPTEMVALDDYFKPGQRVDLIKIDIQGYELHALRGTQRVLQENPGINLLLEFWPAGLEQAGVGWEELVEMLQGLNMNLTLVRTCGLVPFDERDVRNDISWYVNLFAHRSRS